MKRTARQASTLGQTKMSQQAIGARLRELFDEVVQEPVPDEFLELLRSAVDRPAGDNSDF
jgi:hypothetical protein